MRFLIDENIRKEATEFLRAAGHDILILPPGSEDKEIAESAKKTKRVILTHDRHFADILMFPPEEYSGIIRIRIHPPTAPAIINSLGHLLRKFNSPLHFDKKLIILEKDGFRIR